MSLDSQYITPVLVQDQNLSPENKIFYPISSGGNETYRNFPSNSGSSTSSINYNFTLPSDTSFLDRHLMHYSTISHTMTLSAVPVGTSCFNYRSTDSYQAFPFNSLINTLSAIKKQSWAIQGCVFKNYPTRPFSEKCVLNSNSARCTLL
jgi:hypothetical protein